MTNDFLSQEEVDALLRGVDVLDNPPSAFDIIDHWKLNGKFYHVYVRNDKVRTWLYENYVEGEDFTATSSRPITNYIVNEEVFLMMTLKFI